MKKCKKPFKSSAANARSYLITNNIIDKYNNILDYNKLLVTRKKFKERGLQAYGVQGNPILIEDVGSRTGQVAFINKEFFKEIDRISGVKVSQKETLNSPLNEVDDIENHIRKSLEGVELEVDPTNEKNYVDNNTGTKYQRVSNLVPSKSISSNRPASRGNIIDLSVRDLFIEPNMTIEDFKERVKANQEFIRDRDTSRALETSFEFSEESMEELYDIITLFRNENPHMKVMSDIPSLWGEIVNPNYPELTDPKTGKINIAGTIDLLAINDLTGEIYILDLKSSSRNRRDVNDKYYDSYATSDQIQLSTYAELFTQRTGLPISGLFIFPLQVKEDKTLEKVVSIDNNKANLGNSPLIEMRYIQINNPIANSTKSTGQTYDESLLEEPIGDNYIEILEYKKKQHLKANEDLKVAKQKLIQANAKGVGERYDTERKKALENLKKLEKEVTEIENHIALLEKNKMGFMFAAISEDLDFMFQVINNEELYDIDKVNKNLEFYNNLLTPELMELYEEYSPLVSRVKYLIDKNREKVTSTVISMMAEDARFKEVLENLNNKKHRDYHKARRLLDKPTDYVITLEDITKESEDINWFSSQMLGMTDDQKASGIFNKFVYQLFNRTKNEAFSYIHKLEEKLDAFNKKHPTLRDKKFLMKPAEGLNPPSIIGIFTSSWDAEIKSFYAGIKNFRYNSKTFKEKQGHYNEQFNFLKTKANVINPALIPRFKQKYEGHVNDKYFKHSDEQMQNYENSLIELLGKEMYDTYVNNLEAKLEKFDEWISDNKGTTYYEDNMYSRNIWDFADAIWENRPTYSKSATTYGGTVFFNAFSDLIIIPKSKSTFVEMDPTTLERKTTVKDSGFYDENFRELRKDPSKLEAWNIYREMSEYFNETYNMSTERISIPLVKDSIARDLWKTMYYEDDFQLLKKLGSGFKSIFYSQRTPTSSDRVRSNYSSNYESEIKEMMKQFLYRGDSSEVAMEKARAQVDRTYSLDDLDANFKHGLNLAALHNARLQFETLANAIKFAQKNMFANNVNARKKLEDFINTRILNNVFESSGDLVENKTLGKKDRILTKYSAHEKVLKNNYKHLEKEIKKNGPFSYADGKLSFVHDIIPDSEGEMTDIYSVNGSIVNKEDFLKAFDEYITDKMAELGVNPTFTSILDGIATLRIYGSLAISPASGTFNRLEGLHTLFIMDATGDYWEPGMMVKANKWMAWRNIAKTTNPIFNRVGLDVTKRSHQVFEEVIKRFALLQDRKDEFDKVRANVDLNGFLFQWSTDLPEAKNQGQAIFSSWASTYITDNDGNKHRFINPDTGLFSAFDLDEDGKLVLNPNFTDFFGENMESSEMADLLTRAETVVSRVNGNYNKNDLVRFTKSVFTRALMQFKRWMPAHAAQRYGIAQREGEINIDLTEGGLMRDGRIMRTYQANPLVGVLSSLGYLNSMWGRSLLPSITSAITGAGVVGYGFKVAYDSFRAKKGTPEEIKIQADQLIDTLRFLQNVVTDSLNYPSEIIGPLTGTSRLRINTYGNNVFNPYRNSRMSIDDQNAIRTASKELSYQLVGLALKVLIFEVAKDILFGIGGDEDDETSKRRMFINFLQNTITRILATSSNWQANPLGLFTDTERISTVQHIADMVAVATKLGDDSWNDTMTSKAIGSFGVPNAVINLGVGGNMPWHNKTIYEVSPDMNSPLVVKPYKWVHDMYVPPNELAKREYTRVRKDVRTDIKSKFIGIENGKENLTIIADAILAEKTGSKIENEDYVTTMKRLELGQKLDIGNKNVEQVIITKLSERGVKPEQIKKIIDKLHEESRAGLFQSPVD